jgi:Zn-dependent protease with chaperone function
VTTAPVVAAQASRTAVTDHEIRVNRRRAHLLAIGAGAVPGVVLLVVLGLTVGIIGIVIGVVVAVVVAVVISRRATGIVLDIVGGHRLDEDTEPRLANVVDGLCATFGVPRPRLWLVDDPVPNACALGRRPSTAVLVVTSGLLDRLGLIETEAVVAHELAHVKRHDTAVSEVAVALCYPLAGARGADGLVHWAIGRGREYRADMVAAATVRYPPGLNDALRVLEEAPGPTPGSVFTGRRWRASRWMWIDPMVGSRDDPVEGELDATSVRRAALAEW